MFWNTKEPSSGGEHLCLAKVTCGSMVLAHVNSVSIVAAYISCFVCVCVCVCVCVYRLLCCAQRPVHTGSGLHEEAPFQKHMATED